MLQQQSVLPSMYWALLLIPCFFVLVRTYHFQFKLSKFFQKISVLILAILFGFFWAASFATIRLSDELSKQWEQKSIDIIGVIATLPEVTERGERFQFDVEKILTKEAEVPRHISLNYYRDVEL